MPLLFLIRINDLPLCTDYFDFIMFSDDCTLSIGFPKSAISEIHDELNYNFSKVYSWLCVNKVRINCNKTKYMLHSSQRNNNLQGNITMGASEIGITDNFRFLGVIFDDK